MFPSRSFLMLLPLSLGFLLLAVVTGGGLWLSVRQDSAANWARHSLEVERDLNLVHSLVSNAETGQRGYLLTRSPIYLPPYNAAVTRLPGQIDMLDRETADNAAQHKAVRTLRLAVRAKMGEMAATVELARFGRVTEAIAIMRQGSGQRMMTGLSRLIENMRAEERRLLAERTAAADRIAFVTRMLLATGALLVMLLAYAAIRQSADRIGKLHHANEKLVAEAAARDQAEAQLRQIQKMETLGQLTGGIAHDFNNMLAVVIGSLDMLRRRLTGAEDPKAIRYLDSANEGAQRAATLTNRLLAFSRQQPLEPKVLDPNRLVGSMSELIHRTVSEAIEVETALAAGVWRVCADAPQLENAILNLAVNARDAMPSGGKLTIETANSDLDERYAQLHDEVRPGQYVLVSITDTGIGMPEDVARRAIEPFYTTKGVGKGTGLGLSQVFGFAKQSGGHFKIYSEPGRGTTVKLYLPRHIGEDMAPGINCKEGQGAPTGTADIVILVVEDEEQVRHMSVDALRELGYTVVQATDGMRALEQLRTMPKIDLLFTDIVMPGMTGRELADQAETLRPGLKVLYTTGYTRNAVVHNGVVDAGVAFLSKPFSLDALARKVRQVIED